MGTADLPTKICRQDCFDMWISPEGLKRKHGDKEPNIKGLKVGDWFLFCGWCGWQGKENTVSNPRCPDCRRHPVMQCTVEQKDLESGLL